jgi:quinol monooxygenase YgiN
MSEHVEVVATFSVKDGKREAFIAIAQELVNETVKEPGCIKYQLYHDISDPQSFAMIEEWESGAHLDAHLASAHIQAVRPKFGEVLNSFPSVKKYQKV